jgi:hypothetical protein
MKHLNLLPIIQSYLIKTIGQKKLIAPTSAWKNLNYKNKLFNVSVNNNVIKFDINQNQPLNVSLSKHLVKDFMMKTNLVVDNQLSQDEEYMSLDMSNLGLPGRWACMIHDLYFVQNNYPSMIEESQKSIRINEHCDLSDDNVIEYIYNIPNYSLKIIDDFDLKCSTRKYLSYNNMSYYDLHKKYHKSLFCCDDIDFLLDVCESDIYNINKNEYNNFAKKFEYEDTVTISEMLKSIGIKSIFHKH